MKIRKRTLNIIATLTGAGLCLSLYVVISHKQKDKLAVLVLQELNKLLHPSTTGLSSEEAFEIDYADQVSKKVKGVILLKPDAASRYAADIHSAWGIIDDDENKIYGVFRSLKDKVQVSQVSKAYYDAYKINLIDELKSNLNSSEVSTVLKIVNGLVRYRVVK